MNYLEESEKTTKSLRKALVGPLLSAGLMLIGTIAGVLIGVPILENLYESMGLLDQIPPATLAASHFIKGAIKYWYVTVIVISSLVTAFIMWKSTIRGQYTWDMFKIKMPLFGRTCTQTVTSKIFQSYAT